jgi:hypothetical protein
MQYRTTRVFLTTILAATFTVGAGQLFAADASGDASAAASADRLERGIRAHDAVNSGDESQIGEALALLGADGWDRPDVALAYHGSVVTLEAAKAKKAGKLIDALGLIASGTKEIDEAVKRSPSTIEIRMLRMENGMALVETSPANRKAVVAQDIAFLRGRWADLNAEAKAIVELDTGRLALANKKLGEALAAWRKACREGPDSDAATRAKKLLARYGD